MTAEPAAEQSTYGGEAFIRGLKFEIKHKSRFLQKSKLIDGGSSMSIGGARPPCPYLAPALYDMIRKSIVSLCQRINVVVKDIANGAEGHGFDSLADQIGIVSPTAHHRCDVSSELGHPDIKLRRWAPPLVTRFSVLYDKLL